MKKISHCRKNIPEKLHFQGTSTFQAYLQNKDATSHDIDCATYPDIPDKTNIDIISQQYKQSYDLSPKYTGQKSIDRKKKSLFSTLSAK